MYRDDMSWEDRERLEQREKEIKAGTYNPPVVTELQKLVARGEINLNAKRREITNEDREMWDLMSNGF